MKYSLVTLFLFVNCFIFAQSSNHILVKGTVTDILNRPIAYVAIQAVGTMDGCVTDASGNYSFITVYPAVIKASIIGYGIQKHFIKTKTHDTIIMDFILTIDSTELQPINIVAMHEPELIRESGALMDFEVDNNRIWLLYNYRHARHLEVYDTDMHFLSRMILKNGSDDLNLTPNKFLYMQDRDSVYLFDYDSTDKWVDKGEMGLINFHRFIKHLATYNAPYYYYLWTSYNKCALKYWYFKHDSAGFKILYSFENPIFIEQNNELIDELFGDAYTQEPLIPQAMGEQPEYNIIKGEAGRADQGMALSLKKLIHTIDCPLRVIQDSIYIFNFDNDSIYVYDLKNRYIRNVPLSFSLDELKYECKDILVNDEGNECYYKYIANGIMYLQKIDLNSGVGLITQKLKFPFPEKIRIMNGYAYYTYSETTDNGMFMRHLYKQKL